MGKHSTIMWSVLAGLWLPALAFGWEYKGGPLHDLQDEPMYDWHDNDAKFWEAGWNPVPTHRPGWMIAMWGEGRGCEPYTRSGSMRSSSPTVFNYLESRTGIGRDPVRKDLQWTPSGDTIGCDEAVGLWHGHSTVHVHEGEEGGGVGMFTARGLKPDGPGKTFWQGFGPDGQGGGANGYGGGSFVKWTFDWRGDLAVTPFVDGAMQVRSTQGVASFRIDGSDYRKKVIVQAKQQVGWHLINRQCFKERAAIKLSGIVCQFQYLVNTAIYRGGSDVIEKVSTIWYDSAGQGGVPIVEFQSEGGGYVNHIDGQPVMTDVGAGIEYRQAFEPRDYEWHVSWDQFVQTLKALAARRLASQAHLMGESDLAVVFGSGWSDPNEWRATGIWMGQELYATLDDKPVSIGGSVRQLSIDGLAPVVDEDNECLETESVTE